MGRAAVLSLLVLGVLLGAARSAEAQSCSGFGGVLDGFAGDPVPSQLQIDTNCTIRNYPASNPLDTNFSFFTQPGQTDQRWIVIFDNVVHTGNMSCNSVAGHIIWFTNGSSTSIQNGCQNYLIPVEKIDKKNPAGQTTAAVGVPFTWTLTIPVLYDPGTGRVLDDFGSQNDLHSIVITDDLNATGVDLSYVSHVIYDRDTGNPVPHNFTNSGGLLTFEILDPVIDAGRQIIIELTVVLDDTPVNTPGTSFFNTAKWEFGRLIDGEFFEPLPGENGITTPLVIAAPSMTVTKTGPATLGLTLNLGEYGVFTLDAQNNGLTDAWNLTLTDQMPDGPTGGMCDTTPEVLTAQVFQSDGTTPVSGPLVQGVDFALSYSAAPTCELTLSMLSAAAKVGPGERLILTYRTKLDPDSQDGATLTNVAGATEWFNGDSSNPNRLAFVRTLTDGTPGTLDHEDAHTVTVSLFGTFFEKSVANVTSGISPAATAAPGDVLRYTLRLQTTDVPLDSLSFEDDLGVLNAGQFFTPGSLQVDLGTLPVGADASGTNPFGGTNQAGLLNITGIDLPANSQVSIDFEIQVDPNVADGTVILNQADLVRNSTKIADSDDPNINGQADPSVPGDEDPTRIVVTTIPVGPLLKTTTQTTATIGEAFTYQITVPQTPYPFDIYDVRITDLLPASGADLRLVSVSKVSGSQPWTPQNTGTPTDVVIEDPFIGIDIPADEQITVEITVVLEDTANNAAGGSFVNQAGFTYDTIDGDPTSVLPGDPGQSPPITIVEPDFTFTKNGPVSMTIGTPDVFTLDAQNTGQSPAWFATVSDQLPDGASGGMCNAAPTVLTAGVFAADGITPVSGPLTEGVEFTTNFSPAPACLFTLTITSAGVPIGPGERLIVTYETELDPDTTDGTALTNVAGTTQWFSTDGSDPATLPYRRGYSEVLTDGTVGTPDHEDAHTVAGALPDYLFEKTALDPTTGTPLTTAAPGDTVRYRLRLENRGTTPISGLSIHDELDRLNAPPVFEPGTLAIVSAPAGDTSGTDPLGGAQGTGVFDVQGFDLAPGQVLVFEFDVTLAGVIANGTLATNQSQLLIDGAPFVDSDDPTVNGQSDPFMSGDEDPTVVAIQSSPVFLVQKVSDDITGDPAVLLAGETLRYTITVKNVGNANAVDAFLRDAVPANTSYVPGSTTLNGVPVPDAPGPSSPLASGILLSAPEDPTPGAMRADASATTSNVATLVFDVVVDANVVDGTVIANQAFVSAASDGVVDQPSDDPGTALVDDPTRDVVGSVPLLFAPKAVTISVDGGSAGIVDPGDTLHYTITIYNDGAVPATGVVVTDVLPTNTSYVTDSTFLDGAPVGQPDGGTPPLAGGIAVGTIGPGANAVIEFEVVVVGTAVPGDIISNQAVVASDALPDLLTDGDGNPATGPEPTQVVVGNAQAVTITKQVSVVGGGPALAGSTLEYVVTVLNISSVDAADVVITDDLDVPDPGQMTLVAGSATLNGLTTGVTEAPPLITADYGTSQGPLAPGESAVLRFRVVLDPGLAIGTPVTNTGVVTWNAATQTANASVSFDVGGTPGVGILAGAAWHDIDFDRTQDGGEPALAGWSVELLRNGQPLQTVTTDATGAWSIGAVPPNDTNGDQYELVFTAPGAGANTAALGRTDSPFTNGMQRISDVVVSSGSNLQNLNLPIDPNGVVYDAVDRTPVPGATVNLLDAGSGVALPASCFDDPVQQGQVTPASGQYKFELNFSDPACPSPGSYLIAVTVPNANYVQGNSQILPPTSDLSTAAYPVPTCPADAVGATAGFCEADVSELPPQPADPAVYYLHLSFDSSQPPGSSQIYNNHIPLDPDLSGVVGITKTAAKVDVVRGDLVPYEITLTNPLGGPIPDLSLVDRYPAGFHYVKGSAQVDGQHLEPTQNNRELTWTDLGIDALATRRVVVLLAVGAGVTEGKFVNRAQAYSSLTGGALTVQATATVRVVPDPTFDCTDVTGKVFDDPNRNGVQDGGEDGLAAVQVATARGLVATTDAHGRFHITCAVVPREDRGSNFVLKLDDRTLPTGYRLTTAQTQVKRATRGKALHFRFGATIHRVVGLDLADPVFEPGQAKMRMQWASRLDLLLAELEKGPAVLRLSYVADLEDAGLVRRRLAEVRRRILEMWAERATPYTLEIETEVYWRRGAPAGEGGLLRKLLPGVDAGPPGDGRHPEHPPRGP